MTGPGAPPLSAGDAIRRACATLTAAGVESARLDARVLVAAAAGRAAEWPALSPAEALPAGAAATLRALLDRRARGEPVAHLLGRKEFWSLEFEVTPATLTPRPDSETLVEAALRRARDRDRPWRLLDLGTGSGCLLAALLHELPRAAGVGVDLSPAALAVAARNLERLGLRGRAALVCGDWTAAIEGEFDLVVANPPYIAEGDRDALPPEVATYEPALALFGGADGLAAYRRLAPGLAAALAAEGAAFLEVGAGQSEAVAAVAAAAGLTVVAIHDDLGGTPRCLELAAGEKNRLETNRFRTSVGKAAVEPPDPRRQRRP